MFGRFASTIFTLALARLIFHMLERRKCGGGEFEGRAGDPRMDYIRIIPSYICIIVKVSITASMWVPFVKPYLFFG
jgi:hypothetical protein